ncbi:MAG: hypothetical protein Q7T81_17075 [Pseudolabrys sp.]|nr:hypothetical protein [Pseudolabrys sp.]
MTTVKCLKRQAATCASLANQTDDEESRERYLRLEQLYLTLAESEEPPAMQAGPYSSESAASHRFN